MVNDTKKLCGKKVHNNSIHRKIYIFEDSIF